MFRLSFSTSVVFSSVLQGLIQQFRVSMWRGDDGGVMIPLLGSLLQQLRDFDAAWCSSFGFGDDAFGMMTSVQINTNLALSTF